MSITFSRPFCVSANTTLGEVGASETCEPAQSCDGTVHGQSEPGHSAGANDLTGKPSFGTARNAMNGAKRSTSKPPHSGGLVKQPEDEMDAIWPLTCGETFTGFWLVYFAVCYVLSNWRF